jgi:hypothetical protein
MILKLPAVTTSAFGRKVGRRFDPKGGGFSAEIAVAFGAGVASPQGGCWGQLDPGWNLFNLDGLEFAPAQAGSFLASISVAFNFRVVRRRSRFCGPGRRSGGYVCQRARGREDLVILDSIPGATILHRTMKFCTAIWGIANALPRSFRPSSVVSK